MDSDNLSLRILTGDSSHKVQFPELIAWSGNQWVALPTIAVWSNDSWLVIDLTESDSLIEQAAFAKAYSPLFPEEDEED